MFQDIQEKIMGLNFQGCLVKIDAIESYNHKGKTGGKITVDIKGVITKCGQEPREFSQYFILGQQAPKKFYIRLDIFTYKDSKKAPVVSGISFLLFIILCRKCVSVY